MSPRRFHAVLPPLVALATLFAALPAPAAIRRDPTGVNVNAQGATTVFLTFGGLSGQVPVEATWCSTLIPAAPDIGFKCDPATIFGRLPIRYDQSQLKTGSFTDIMTIPPSVSRRAYQRAEGGASGTFFYVRRFQSLAGGPDEYVFVTCRMAGGSARSPLALTDVQVRFGNAGGAPNVGTVEPGAFLPRPEAAISYTGTGQLRGRWEIVFPGEEPPTARDLLTEATLPPDERPFQKRYTLVDRFSVFLPPGGVSFVLTGPDPSKIPTAGSGLHLLLLRVEAANDREADSNLGAAGAGQGVVHSGGVAGFPMPPLRYVVGSAGAGALGETFAALLPAADTTLGPAEAVVFSWTPLPGAALYRLELLGENGAELFAATLEPGVEVYRAPPFVRERVPAGTALWRVRALGPTGEQLGATTPRRIGFEAGSAPVPPSAPAASVEREGPAS